MTMDHIHQQYSNTQIPSISAYQYIIFFLYLALEHFIYIYIYIYIYRYITMIDIYTKALFLTKPSSDNDSGFRHGFGAEASIPPTQQ